MLDLAEAGELEPLAAATAAGPRFDPCLLRVAVEEEHCDQGGVVWPVPIARLRSDALAQQRQRRLVPVLPEAGPTGVLGQPLVRVDSWRGIVGGPQHVDRLLRTSGAVVLLGDHVDQAVVTVAVQRQAPQRPLQRLFVALRAL